tara:strand:+ start:315 stop:614 length:300 start_codon:yes stop_codon:yes gene_type:complete
MFHSSQILLELLTDSHLRSNNNNNINNHLSNNNSINNYKNKAMEVVHTASRKHLSRMIFPTGSQVNSQAWEDSKAVLMNLEGRRRKMLIMEQYQGLLIC